MWGWEWNKSEKFVENKLFPAWEFYLGIKEVLMSERMGEINKIDKSEGEDDMLEFLFDTMLSLDFNTVSYSPLRLFLSVAVKYR